MALARPWDLITAADRAPARAAPWAIVYAAFSLKAYDGAVPVSLL